MKDDFYKDMNHKRAQDEKSSKSDSQSKKSQSKKRETLSRSARHKPKEAPDSKVKPKQQTKTKSNPNANVKPKTNPKQQKQQTDENNFTTKLKGYFSADNAAKGKAIFAGKFSTYQSRIKNELKMSKEKLGGIGAAKATGPKKKNNDKDSSKRKLPWVLALLILIPLTILFAFLIFSNFWPEIDDEIKLADENTSEDAASNDEESGVEDGFNAELEAQKAEHEKRLAENRDEDLSSKELETNYSQEELQKLEEASLNAIRTKEDAPESPEEPADTEEESAEDTTSEDSTEDAEEPDTAEEDTETETPETENANASHVVTPSDNLYRIAIQYYGDGSAANVQRIMEANGVTPDNLTVGQELIIP